MTNALGQVKSFGTAFEKMCNFVAISKTKSSNETLQELVLQCLMILPDEIFNKTADIVNAIEVLFGLEIPDQEIVNALDILISQSKITRLSDYSYVLGLDIKHELRMRLDAATGLEERVQEQWFEELSVTYPQLPKDIMWKTLRSYLAKSFRRHGIQAVIYLDPSSSTLDDSTNGLTSLLREAINEVFEKYNAQAENAISSFLALLGEYPDRIQYIAQLADGAFNYYSLTVDPDVAEKFREHLEPLTLFLDTNFLFGILDLHNSSLIDVSKQILISVEKHNLPFKLRYHVATGDEFRTTINYYSDRLRKRDSWPQQLSRVASRTQNISGIELTYHQKNAKNPLSPEIFMSPYQHFDVILKRKLIEIYRNDRSHRLEEKNILQNEYVNFLAYRKKIKPESAIEHDVIVLDTVLELQDKVQSSLNRGAILLTCDYTLYKFDQMLSKRRNKQSCVLLPNLFMQLLRPFIPSNKDFDKSFAETFSIPEFRSMSSDVALATSKILNLFASYQVVPDEQTAFRMLSNKALLENLSTVKEDQQFQELIEAEFVNDNQVLMEEKAELERQLDIEKLKRQEESIASKNIANRERQEKLLAIEAIEREKSDKQSIESDLKREKEARNDAEYRIKQEKEQRIASEKKLEQLSDAGAIIFSIFCFIITIVLIDHFKINFLLNHPRSHALQALIGLLIGLFISGLLRNKWRPKVWWGSGGIAVLIAIFSLL